MLKFFFNLSHIFIVSVVPSGGLVILGAMPSAGARMTMFWSCVHRGPAQ